MALGTEHHPLIRRCVAREAELHSLDWMNEWLQLLNPCRTAQLHTLDGYQIVRALEMVLSERAGSVAGSAGFEDVLTLPKLGVPWRKFGVTQSPEIRESN